MKRKIRSEHPENESARVPRKSLVLGVVIIALVLFIITVVVVLKPSFRTTGQAYRPGTATVVSSVTDLAVYFEPAVGYAAPGDADIDIPIMIRAADLPAGQTIEAIQFCLQYDYDTFDVRDLQISLSGYSRLTPPSDVAGWLGSANSGPPSPCPSGYTKHVDVAVGASDTPIRAGAQLGMLKMSVTPTAPFSTGDAQQIEILTTFVSGSEGLDDRNQKLSTTSMFIVPPCPDGDRDGYAEEGTIQRDGVEDSDMRACEHTNPLSGTLVLDCDDNNAARFPGNPEICDNLDNNCDNSVDNGLPLILNDPPAGQTQLYGVCFGYKQCNGAAVMMEDSYLSNPDYHPDSTDPCDFYDNDCDGQFNEDAAPGSCTIGTTGIAASPDVGQIASSVPGNVFIEYASNMDGATYGAQRLTLFDQFFFNLLRTTDPTRCGGTGLPICDTDLTDTIHIWYCLNNVYYLGMEDGSFWKASADNNPATTNTLTRLNSQDEVPATC